MPVSLDDRFHLGSNTKSMTATLAGMLVEEGRLGWGSTVGEVLGREVPGLSRSLAGATLAQLLSHASGIPGDTEDMLALYLNGNPFDYNPPALRLRTLAAWKHHVVTVPEGSPFQYSNFGYVLAGSMIEKAAGTPWEELMYERIFVPIVAVPVVERRTDREVRLELLAHEPHGECEHVEELSLRHVFASSGFE